MLRSTTLSFDTDVYLMQNRSNHDAHFDGTGPEIWRQTNGRLKAFVSGAGEIINSFDTSCSH